MVGFDESNADPRPPRPKPPVLAAGGAGAEAGLSFVSETGSADFEDGLEGVGEEDLAPNALWPNTDPPKETGFDDPNPANPPVEGTDPKALAVEVAPKAVGLEG